VTSSGAFCIGKESRSHSQKTRGVISTHILEGPHRCHDVPA